ncbi:MAG: polysaccharide biosynthesis protein [Thermoleophilia bacterium]|nr:polysaccharide biosynthesis protein [Thermoleophilia bacterium]MCZ4495877.1 polysaccharide biosynthesis protein [Thermoleophilia bacterium]
MVMQAETTTTVADDVVPLAQPFLNGREIELVTEVLRSGRLSLGPMVTRFEDMFASFVGTKHAVAVSSGTTGLHVAAITAGWGEGDEVITSPFSFVSSANIARYTGATVTFADIDPQTLNLDPAAVEAAVTSKTRGIVPVDIFGWPVDMDALSKIAGTHDLTMVEDACEALGATYKGRNVGAAGVPAVFAFYANKQMTTGEGGMLVTDDDHLAAEWRSLINQGRADSGQWLAHDRLGYNYRLSDIASAVGVAQLEKLNRILTMRREVAFAYNRLLADIPGVNIPLADGDGNERSWFVYYVVLDEGIDRNDVMLKLTERGVQCKPYLPSIHLQPYFRELGFREGMFPVAESISARSLALPFFPQMSPQQQQRVADELRDVLAAG